MKKIIFIISLLSNLNLYTYNCGDSFYCNPNLKYPYYQCDNTGKTAIVVCSDSPTTLNPKPVFSKMPICLEINWKDVPSQIKLPTMTGEEVVFDISKFSNDVITAQNNMNCICGKQNTSCSQGCKIKIMFVNNPGDLRYKNAPGEADFIWSFPNSNKRNCTGKCDGTSIIKLNNTNGFKGVLIDGYYQYNFCNSDSQYYLKKSTKYNTVNLLTVIMHEIGHMMGLDHFNVHRCNGSPEETSNSLMNSIMDANAPPKELTVYNKCAIAKLHCPSLTPVEESDIVEEEIYKYPNPAEDYIVFSTNSILGNENVIVYSTFGQKYILNFINTNEGLKIDISNLSPGVYFVKIGDKVEKFVKY